jgi:methionyl-tRNA formyltransferase
LAALSRHSLQFTPQPAEGATYAAKIGNDEARIDWHRPAATLHDQVRGLSPFPGAFFEADLGKGTERVKVLRAEVLHAETVDGQGEAGTLLDAQAGIACGLGALRLLTVQRAGRGPVSGEDFLRGIRLQPGARLAATRRAN